MTALLPVAPRGIKTELVHDVVPSLCLFFNAIKQKVIEATFPPTFIDLMLHLTTHLAREIWYLGPSFLHQMFPYERFFGFLKSMVHNRLFLEGANVRSYETIEAVESALGYMDPQEPIGVLCSQHEGRLSGVGTLGKSQSLETICLPKGSFHCDTTATPNYTICQ
jgi:hypothetical protein